MSSSDKFVYLCIHGVILLKLNANYFEKYSRFIIKNKISLDFVFFAMHWIGMSIDEYNIFK